MLCCSKEKIDPMKEKLTALKHCIISKYISDEELPVLARLLTIHRYSPNTEVASQGESEERLCIIGTGEVRLEVDHEQNPGYRGKSEDNKVSPIRLSKSRAKSSVVKTGAAVRTVLCKKKKGEYFGGRSLGTEYDNLSYSVFTNDETTLIVLTRTDFQKFTAQYPKARDRVFRALGYGLNVALSNLALFRCLDSTKVTLLCAAFRAIYLNKDSTLFKRGELGKEGNSLHYLLDGGVTVLMPDEAAKRLHREELKSVQIQHNPSTPTTTRVTSKSVIKRDKPPDKAVAVVERGEFFGEVGLVIHLPRTATVITRKKSIFLELSQDHFRNFVKFAPEILDAFRDRLEDYQIPFRVLIHNPILQKYFMQYLESEKLDQNLKFWLKVREFRKDNSADTKLIQEQAEKIVNSFQLDKPKLSLGIEKKTRDLLIQDLKANRNVTRVFFLRVEDEVLKSLTENYFPQFKQSKPYQLSFFSMTSQHNYTKQDELLDEKAKKRNLRNKKNKMKEKDKQFSNH